MSQASDSRLSLHVLGAERSDTTVTLTYRLDNLGDTPLWVFNVLYRVEPNGAYVLDLSRAYSRIEADQVLGLTRALVPLRDDLLVEFPEIPCVSRLGGRASVQDTIHLQAPSHEDLPYDLEHRRLLPLASLQGVKLRLGYLEDRPGLRFHRGKDLRERAFQYPHYGDAIQAQHVLETPVVKLQQSVRVPIRG